MALPSDLWIHPGGLAKGPKDDFYGKLYAVLAAMNFAGQIQWFYAGHYKGDVPAAGPPSVIPPCFSKC